MELKTAIEILEYHQEWRQGRREDMIHEPKKLTEALDILLAVAKKHHSVDTNEMIDHIGDGNEMVNQVPDAGKMVEDDVEKLAEKYPYGGREGSKRLAFIDGYNKAKKTLYTEEDMWHIFAKGMGAENLQQKGVKNAAQVFDTFMKSLKQPNTKTL